MKHAIEKRITASGQWIRMPHRFDTAAEARERLREIVGWQQAVAWRVVEVEK